jgi:hypothetical protein
MRWLIIQSAGQHNGSDGWTPNDYLRECLSLQDGLKQAGAEADVWGLRHTNFDQTPDFNSYDVILYLEQYEMSWLPDFSKINKPLKLLWGIDLHCGARSRLLPLMPYFDWILHSTKALIPEFEKLVPRAKHLWFPNAYDDRFFYPRHLAKTLETVFVGNLANRRQWLELCARELDTTRLFATGEDMLTTISMTKVHLNKAYSIDVNYRNFETCGLGTCLCTNRLSELEELGFEDGVNCLLYDSDEDMIRKVRTVLADVGWLPIGTAGAEMVAARHSYRIRCRDLLKQVLSCK